LFYYLSSAPQRQRPSRNRIGDDAARAHVAVGADFDRSDQRRIAADKRARPDLGAMLQLAIVVTGNRTRADVRMVADLGVAQVREMLALRLSAEPGFFQLDEIADLGARPHSRVHA